MTIRLEPEQEYWYSMMTSLANTALKFSVTTLTLLSLALMVKFIFTQPVEANGVAKTSAPLIEVSAKSGITKHEVTEPKLNVKRYRRWSDVQHDRWCHKTYKSYSSRTGKYISETGKRVLCQSPMSDDDA